MVKLTEQGRARVAEIAARHGVGAGTAERLIDALARGGGTQAQFDEPELGGMGQWSRGGMVMVGDMFNNALKARVDALCGELAALAGEAGVFAPLPAGGVSGGWPAEFGRPSATGSQNDMRYAVFPDTRRLVVARGAAQTVYDTGEHSIGGIAQAQSGDQTLTFTSQRGPVPLSELRVVEPAVPQGAAAAAPAGEATPAGGGPAGSPQGAANPDVLATIERLAELRSRGILTDEEFSEKKSELLARL